MLDNAASTTTFSTSITAAYRDEPSFYMTKYAGQKSFINFMARYAQKRNQRILIIRSADTLFTEAANESRNHTLVIELTPEMSRHAMWRMADQRPLLSTDLYKKMVAQLAKTELFETADLTAPEYVAAGLAMRISASKQLGLQETLEDDLWMLFNKVYPKARVLLLDAQNLASGDEAELSFCFYQADSI